MTLREKSPTDRRCGIITRPASVIVMSMMVALTGCGAGAGSVSTTATAASSTPNSSESTGPIESAASSPVATEPSEPPAPFPVEAFAAISEDPVTEALAAKFQAALAMHDVTGGGGMSATVMTAQGAWSGTTGLADGVRDLQVDDQFAIASITKSVVATQVMLMVEAGELALDDLAADHLPADIEFDTNGATIRQLLGHRSGLPDYYEVGPLANIDADAQRVWPPAELLPLVPSLRTTPGDSFSYAETNYLVLKLVIEHLRERPLAEVVRDGALGIDGLDRLVYQPDEAPTEPMAMPAGASQNVFEARGGYLPSLGNASAYQASGGIASDSRSLAQWWRALCAGEIVSQASLTEMATFEPAPYLGSYGLGLYNPASGYADGFGHTGQLPGYMTWAAMPARGRSGHRRAEQSRGRRRPSRVVARAGPSAGRRPSLRLTGTRPGGGIVLALTLALRPAKSCRPKSTTASAARSPPGSMDATAPAESAVASAARAPDAGPQDVGRRPTPPNRRSSLGCGRNGTHRHGGPATRTSSGWQSTPTSTRSAMLILPGLTSDGLRDGARFDAWLTRTTVTDAASTGAGADGE